MRAARCPRCGQPGAVDDAVVAPIAAQDAAIALTLARRQLLACVCLAWLGMEKNRAHFGIGLRLGKGTIGKNEVRLTLRHPAETMPARNPAAVGDCALRDLAVRVR